MGMGSYGKLPEELAQASADVARETAAALGSLGEGARDAAALGGRGLSSALGGAEQLLAGPSGASVAGLLGETDLPELDERPLESLARRLDREADLWRSLALRQLAQADFALRGLYIVWTLALLASLGLAGLAVFTALVAPAEALARLALFGASGGAVGLGVAWSLWLHGRQRSARLEVARQALTRADLAELRLHRLALVLAQQGTADGPAALQRLEQDARR